MTNILYILGCIALSIFIFSKLKGIFKSIAIIAIIVIVLGMAGVIHL